MTKLRTKNAMCKLGETDAKREHLLSLTYLERKEMSQHEAKSNLLPITGHSTMTALEKYLRDIDAELPEDYSRLLV